MKVWINKQEIEEVSESYHDAFIFNMLDENNRSNLKSDIENLWRRFSNLGLQNVNEDLLILSIAVFAADKKINRSKSKDAWTREIELNVPVLEWEQWSTVKEDINILLGFLTGDRWNIQFRKTELHYRNNVSKRRYNIINKDGIEVISLFSGGLDSFSGAIKLLEEGKKVCFVGFREYSHLEKRQEEIFDIIKHNYPDAQKEFVVFHGTPHCPIDMNGNKLLNNGENTSRSRSFMFLAGALAVASQISNGIPVMIPENGFIGINVPLTDSRKGSCSTRTTHPFFINKLNEILLKLNIKNQVQNFYAYQSKGEIIYELKNIPAFREGYSSTISCSHPCQARINKKTIPMNCGYCYPCIIRKASLCQVEPDNTSYDYEETFSKNFIEKQGKFKDKKYNAGDLKAVLASVFRLNSLDEKEVKALIMQTGKLNINEINRAYRLYTKNMQEIKELILKSVNKNDSYILKYAGINKNE